MEAGIPTRFRAAEQSGRSILANWALRQSSRASERGKTPKSKCAVSMCKHGYGIYGPQSFGRGKDDFARSLGPKTGFSRLSLYSLSNRLRAGKPSCYATTDRLVFWQAGRIRQLQYAISGGSVFWTGEQGTRVEPARYGAGNAGRFERTGRRFVNNTGHHGRDFW